jgi:hypothetical protein
MITTQSDPVLALMQRYGLRPKMPDADQDGVTIEEWLENLSEKGRQRLIDYLMDADTGERLRKEGRLQ